MKTYLCSLYNSTTGHYSAPLLFETKEQAVTSFSSEILAPQSELANIKDTLSIFCVGRYEHTSGKLSPYLFKKLLLKGSEILLPSPSTEKESN
ncbi:MAG: hypothetical protein [Wigfec virus K19_174]|nr:MAG: hypothetical protein [Wigfec virus K19_174]